MRAKSKLAAIVFAAAMTPAAFAADLVVTQSEATSKSGRVSFSIDLASSGDVSGFNFILRTNAELKRGSVDVSKCVADLPKAFAGECRVNKDGIYFFAMSNDKSVLPSGVISVGKVSMPAELTSKGALSIDMLEMIDASGEIITSNAELAQ